MIVSGNVGIGTATVANKFDNGAVSIGYQNTAAPSSGLLVSGNVGIGTSTVTNKLDINGGIAVGTQYAGAAAPTSGLIVQGNVGIGTKSPGALFTVGSNSFRSEQRRHRAGRHLERKHGDGTLRRHRRYDADAAWHHVG